MKFKVKYKLSLYEFVSMLITVVSCAWMFVFGVLSLILNSENPLYSLIAFLSIPLFILTARLISSFVYKRSVKFNRLSLDRFLLEKSSDVVRNQALPCIVVDKNNTVLWANDTADILFRSLGLESKTVTRTLSVNSVGKVGGASAVSFENEKFEVYISEFSDETKEYSFLSFVNITDKVQLAEKYDNEKTVVGYIVLDNLEDVLQMVHENYSEAVSAIDVFLTKWAKDNGIVLKSYDHNKYFLIFNKQKLNILIDDRFSLLDTVRNTRIGDNTAVTVSVGISDLGETLVEREKSAVDALDLALQRGGDQAVVITADGVSFYGGKTHTVYKRTNVRSRTVTSQLSSLITRSENVVIMGHRFGDFDSLGASVGLARLCMICGVKVNIAFSLEETNLSSCIDYLKEDSEYKQIFIDSAEALDMIAPDTLLILTDTGSEERSQFPEIAARAKKIVIIDHHRKAEVPDARVLLSYIEPSASSASELVTEMLAYATPANNLLKSEADMLLAGILLDTKQFSRNTGTRTFSSAEYLRSAGANPPDVYDMFKLSVDDIAKETEFLSNITVYDKNIAISCCNGKNDESYRIVASKIADKLLSLQNIEAAFAVVQIDDSIHISGRSSGNINVQLILEQLHGGGRFDVAGALVKNDTVSSVLTQLKNAIDNYNSQL